MSTNLDDAILAHIDNELFDTFTAMQATITDISLLSENKVSVQPANDILIKGDNYATQPVLTELPIIWPAGGGAVMTFPLSIGDDVMVIFTNGSKAEFQASTSGTVQPFDQRIHDIADGYVMPCIFRDSNQPSPNTEDLEIRYGDGEITIKKDGTISYFNSNGSQTLNANGSHSGVAKETWSMTNGTGELIDLLTQCLQTISDTTVNTVYGSSPLNSKPAIDALIVQLETFKE